jgi:anti-sigma B factor antagonist
MAATAFSDDVLGPALQIAVTQDQATVTIALAGEWDLAQRQVTRQAIRAVLQRSPENVVVDLSELTFIDSSGIHVIVELHKRATQHEIGLVIVPGPRAVQRPFEICGLTDVLAFAPVA